MHTSAAGAGCLHTDSCLASAAVRRTHFLRVKSLKSYQSPFSQCPAAVASAREETLEILIKL